MDEVIVYAYHMNRNSGESHGRRCQGRSDRFAFTRIHLHDRSIEECLRMCAVARGCAPVGLAVLRTRPQRSGRSKLTGAQIAAALAGAASRVQKAASFKIHERCSRSGCTGA